MKIVNIGKRQLGPGQPCFIIAEAGVNHNGDLALARRLVEAAAEAGADAVKFQTFKAERLVTPDAPKAGYQRQRTNAAESQYEMLRRLELSPEAHAELLATCRQRDILFMSTPFDEESADLLQALDLAVFKVPSGELTNLPFLAHLAGKGKPLIVSTGMAYLGEVEAAVRTIRAADCQELVLLHCVSAYPANPKDVNLRAMQTLQTAFQMPVGYSDHTLGLEVAFAAVALGASVIEKHFTLDRNLPGPDHRASLEAHELRALVEGIRTIETALGHGRKEPAAGEAETAAVARKSLVAGQDLAAGTILTEAMIAIKRPGSGLSPALRPQLIGRRLNQNVPADTLLTWEMLS